MQADGNKVYHKACFKCSVCQLSLDLTNFATHEEKLYCDNHFKNLRHQKALAQFEKDKLTAEQEDHTAGKKRVGG